MQTVFLVAVEGVQCAIFKDKSDALKLKSILLSHVDQNLNIQIYQDNLWDSVEDVITHLECEYNKNKGAIN